MTEVPRWATAPLRSARLATRFGRLCYFRKMVSDGALSSVAPTRPRWGSPAHFLVFALFSACTAPVAPDATVLPEETADEAALDALADWGSLPSLHPERYQQQSSR